MKGNEKQIVKALVAVAWADGKVEAPERSMIESLLWAFGADDEDEREVLAFAAQKRTLAEALAPTEFSRDDKELLFAHAALMTHADGEQTADEADLLADLARRLGLSTAEAASIDVRTRAARFASRR
jgi:tellurite resistance protein